MHIVVFLQYYHTLDCATAARPYALVERLARDHRITLITTREGHDRRLTYRYPWIPPGVDLHMLEVSYDNRMSAGLRLQAYLRYAAHAFVRGLRLAKPDLIIGSSTPLTAACTAAASAAWWKVPWIFEVRDLWPAFPIQMGAVPGRWTQHALHTLERTLYQRAAHVVTLSPDMEAHVRAHLGGTSVPVTTIEYGAEINLIDQVCEAELQALRRDYDLGDRKVVLYAGTLGRANDIPTLIEAAERLRDRDDLCFVVVGNGYHAADLRTAAWRLPALRVLPPQPHPRTLALFQLATLSVVSFIDRPVLATNSPSKLFDSLAAGTPVVVTNPGWTRRLVEQHGCGWFVPPSQSALLADRLAALLDQPALLRAAGARAARLARQRFDRRALMDRWAAVVEAVGASGMPPAAPPPDDPEPQQALNGMALI